MLRSAPGGVQSYPALRPYPEVIGEAPRQPARGAIAYHLSLLAFPPLPAVLARLPHLLIIAFWLTMTGLLVRTEFSPAKSRLRAVSIEHVLKLVFAHEQPSDLNILNGGLRIGQLHLQPRIEKEGDRRLLDFSGSLQLRLPGVPRQRFTWSGAWEADAAFTSERLRFAFALLEPIKTQTEVEIDSAQQLAHVRFESGEGTLRETYTLDEAGLHRLLGQLAIDPAVLQVFAGRNPARPEITAEQSSLSIHGQRLETYCVTIQQSGQTLVEFHVSQLGQILKATTLVGYTLSPDGG